jgi:ABC-type dipeptide/oligopeptide/nickel transport system permease component
MRAYVVRRILLAVPTLLLVSLLVFSLMHLIPGDAVIARLQEVGVVTDVSIQAVRRELGLDLSLLFMDHAFPSGLVCFP